MGSICAAKDGNNTYYVYRETYRVKINPGHEGKKRGSGRVPRFPVRDEVNENG